MENYVVTIARSFGSGGRVIGAKLADELGIHSYENRILTLAAKYSGRDEYDFVEVDEKLRGSYLHSQLSKIQKRFTPHPKSEEFKSDDRLFEFQAHIIRELPKLENCIIVGKCADYVLRDYSRLLRVYIGSPFDYCVRRVMERMNVSAEEAEHIVLKSNRYRKDYYKYYTGGRNWRDPDNYDIMLNNAEFGDDNSVELIKDALCRKLNIEL
ncbi:cytidylate kinase-like family protein [Lacrimispora sp.]|uniref:cytidylate kinase-like family protein n=1 Tax=Lacrimispora sp. TaxID=2719234 RepID=UPI0034603E00